MIQHYDPLESLKLLPKSLRDATPEPPDLPDYIPEDVDPIEFWTLEGVRGHVCTN